MITRAATDAAAGLWRPASAAVCTRSRCSVPAPPRSCLISASAAVAWPQPPHARHASTSAAPKKGKRKPAAPKTSHPPPPPPPRPTGNADLWNNANRQTAKDPTRWDHLDEAYRHPIQERIELDHARKDAGKPRRWMREVTSASGKKYTYSSPPPSAPSSLAASTKVEVEQGRVDGVEDRMVEEDAEMKRKREDEEERLYLSDARTYDPDPEGFRLALESGDRVEAWQKFKDLAVHDMVGGESSFVTEEDVVRLLTLLSEARSPRLSIMMQVADVARQKMGMEGTIDTYNAMLGACARLGDFTGGRAQLGEMARAGIRPNLTTYNFFLKLYVKEGDLDGASAFFDKMLEEGISPDASTFDNLIQVALQVGNREAALQFYRDMRELDIDRSDKTYALMMKLHADEKDYDAVKTVFQEACDANVTFTTPLAQLLIRIFGEGGRIEDAQAVFTTVVRQDGADVSPVYSSMIHAYFRSGDVDGAMDFFARMHDQGIRVDYLTYITALEGFCAVGRPADGERVMVSMKSAGYAGNLRCYTTLIRGYLGYGVEKPGNAENASHTIETLPQGTVGAPEGGVADATRLFEQMRIEEVHPPTSLYNLLLKGIAEDFDMELLARYWARWQTAVKKQDASEKSLASQHEEMDAMELDEKGMLSKRAVDMWRRQKSRQKNKVPLPRPNAVSHSIVLEAYVTCGATAQALTALKDMLAEGFDPETRLFLALCAAHVRQRQYVTAAEVIVMMRKSLTSRSADVKPIIAKHAAEFERLVLHLLEDARDVEDGGDGLGELALKLAQPGSSEARMARELKKTEADERKEAEAKRVLGVELYRELVASGCELAEATFRAVIVAHHRVGDLVAAVKAWTSMRSAQKATLAERLKKDQEFNDGIGADAIRASLTPKPETVCAMLACVRDCGRETTARAIIKLVDMEKLPLGGAAGYAVLLAVMARFGWVDDLRRRVLDMVNDGVAVTSEVLKGVMEALEEAGDENVKDEVVAFLEENWPEALVVEDAADDFELEQGPVDPVARGRISAEEDIQALNS